MIAVIHSAPFCSLTSLKHDVTYLWVCFFLYASLYQDAISGRLHVVEGVLVIEEVVPSDGGLYSCMAVSTSGNASRDVAILSKSLCSNIRK